MCQWCLSFTLKKFLRISSIDDLLKCPSLQHAGLAFNRIRSLPSVDDIPPSCQLISLDVSQNDLVDLTAVCSSLQGLPQLRSVVLSGNPFCLLPAYDATVRQALKLLKYFDHIVSHAGAFDIPFLSEELKINPVPSNLRELLN